MSRMNQWFVLGDGIAREVITADIQRYLGPDALVRPGTGTGDHEGRPGYWITAYRTLTSQMIQDLRMDSQRWRAEKDNDQRAHRSGGSSLSRDTKVSRQPDVSIVAYQDSQTHASRQYHGPTEGRATSHPASSYGGASESHYTTTPTPTYPAHQGYGPPATHTTQPRTDPYAANNYGQPAAVAADYRYPATTPAYAYPPQTPQDPYGRPTVTPHYAPQQPSVQTAAPGYYIASDGRQYPLSQQPQRRGN